MAVGGVRHRGGFPDRRTPRNRRRHERSRGQGGRADRHRRHEGRRQGRGRRRLHLHRRRRRHPRGQAAVARPRAARRQGGAVRDDRRARDGRHAGPRRPGHRRRHRLRHRARARTGRAPARGRAVDAVDARRDPRRRRHRGQRTGQGLPVRADPRRGQACRSQPQVLGACDMLGIDPLYVANEGKFVAIVAARRGRGGDRRAARHIRKAPMPRSWARSSPEPHGIVALRTSFGGSRIVDMLVGDPLPRIC